MWFTLPILALVVIIYFATGSPIAASVLPYVAAAWPSVRSACWLHAHDPAPQRGRACFWFFLGAAGWRAGVAGIVSLFMLGTLEAVTGVRVDLDSVAQAIIAALAGLCIATVLGVAGILSAWRERLHVFVVPNLFRMCNGDFDLVPDALAGYRGFNHAIFVLVCSLFVPLVVGACALSAGTFKGEAPNAISLATTCATAMILIGPLLMIPVYAFFSVRIIARHPWDCWPPEVRESAERDDDAHQRLAE